MSFDLGVWHSDAPLSDQEAGEIYVRLCEHWPFLGGESRFVAAFYDELTERWPEIDAVPDEEIDSVRHCPWSCALNRSGMAVVMSCVWPMAEEVAAFVANLAEKHGLVLFDPQTGTLLLPERLRPR